MKLFRKMTALLLSVLIAFSVLYVLPEGTFLTASAAEIEDESDTGATSGDFTYEILDDESVRITSYRGNGEEAVIPDMIGKYKVTELGSVFSVKRNLKSIIVGQYVKTIDKSRFCDYTAVERIEVSEQNPYLKSVDGVVYSKDGKKLVRTPEVFVSSFSIPAGVEVVGEYALTDSEGLEHITFAMT